MTNRFARFVFIASLLSALLLLCASPVLAEPPPNGSYSQTPKKDDTPLLGDFNAGATVGAGVISPLSFQVLGKYDKIIGLNVEYGLLPKIKLSDSLSVDQHMFDVSAHVYPFRGDFFLGLGLGFQKVLAEDVSNGNSVRANVSSVFLSPRLGFLHRFDCGLALGADLGVMLPVSGDVSITDSSGAAVPSGLRKASTTFEKTPLPIIHVIQLGYVF